MFPLLLIGICFQLLPRADLALIQYDIMFLPATAAYSDNVPVILVLVCKHRTRLSIQNDLVTFRPNMNWFGQGANVLIFCRISMSSISEYSEMDGLIASWPICHVEWYVSAGRGGTCVVR